METTTTLDSNLVLNIVSITISTILSVGAIILSIWFYRESNKQNKETSVMNVQIKEAIEKLERLYDRTYTDTFGALRGQMDAMQKHIFSNSVGDTSSGQPNKLRLYVLGCISQTEQLTIEEICAQVTGFEKTKITETVYAIHQEGVIEFDGKTIKRLQRTGLTNQIQGKEPQ